MPLIRLNNGGYRYPGTDKWIFRGLEFAADAGEAVRLVGRNGSGKTTLLKVLTGILPLTEGSLKKGPHTRAAYMDQFAGEMLARDLTIAEQFKMATQPANDAASLGADPLVQFNIGLQHRTTDFVGYLSGGQQQVIALLSTLLAGANLLCLDEFASSLDGQSAAVAGRLLEHARTAAKAALILVGHGSIGTHVDREFCAPLVES